LKGFHFRAVTFVRGKNDTCYQMYTTEEGFYPEPSYFTLTSAVASLLHNNGVSVLQAGGFVRAFDVAVDFRASLVALSYTRPLIAKYDKEIINEDLQNNRIKENMITLGNIKLVLYGVIIIIISAGASFIAEVCSKQFVLMMLK